MAQVQDASANVDIQPFADFPRGSPLLDMTEQRHSLGVCPDAAVTQGVIRLADRAAWFAREDPPQGWSRLPNGGPVGRMAPSLIA